MSSDPKRTHYKVLMLAEHADQEIVSVVYRKLAQRYHPDVDPSAEAAHRMADINESYAVLRDPDKRRKVRRVAGQPARSAPERPFRSTAG